MNTKSALLISALLWLGLSASPTEPASQTGGLPALDFRLGTLESTVAEQGTVGAALQVTVDDLQNQLNGVQNDLATLERRLPMFAVVDADGTLRASRGVESAGHSLDSSQNPLTGFYRVVFDRNVWLCAATVTAEPLSSGKVKASINGTFRGVVNPNPEFSPNALHIVVFDEDNNFVDTRFNIIVSC
jgi:uncharacterized coiled-coil protein SlyX